ncbi:MAG: DegV family protein [Nocardioides sp.]
MSPVAIVTDSTANLSSECAAAHGITVVGLQVVVGDTVMSEGVRGGATPTLVAQALRARVPVSTSRPPPAAFAAAYGAAAAAGASAVVSIHLSATMSGTYESAQIAARSAPVPVFTVDSRQVGIATGFAVLTAASLRGWDLSGAQIAAVARARAEATRSLFYVDTLDHLSRGGRIGAAAALVGGALSVKPLLCVKDGEVASLERVRTATRALARLADLAVDACGSRQVDVGVAHLANPTAAEELVQSLRVRLAPNLAHRALWCGEVGAALGAHVGPGMLAVCVAPAVSELALADARLPEEVIHRLG